MNCLKAEIGSKNEVIIIIGGFHNYVLPLTSYNAEYGDNNVSKLFKAIPARYRSESLKSSYKTTSFTLKPSIHLNVDVANIFYSSDPYYLSH